MQAPKKSQHETKGINDLKLALDAVGASEHNPVDWGAVIRFTAPIIARLAARYATRYVGSKLAKRIPPKLANDTAEKTAERIAVIVAKRYLK